MFMSMSPFIGEFPNLSQKASTVFPGALITAFQWKAKSERYNVVLVLFAGCPIFRRCNKKYILGNHSFNYSFDFIFVTTSLFSHSILYWFVMLSTWQMCDGHNGWSSCSQNYFWHPLFLAEPSRSLFLAPEATFRKINHTNIAIHNGPTYSLWMLLFLAFTILILLS